MTQTHKAMLSHSLFYHSHSFANKAAEKLLKVKMIEWSLLSSQITIGLLMIRCGKTWKIIELEDKSICITKVK